MRRVSSTRFRHSPAARRIALASCVGASMEDAVAATHLIVKRIPERYPNIRFIVPHFGGILPMLLQRLDGQLPQQGFAGVGQPDGPSLGVEEPGADLFFQRADLLRGGRLRHAHGLGTARHAADTRAHFLAA